jgi:hypothetical protein
VRVADCGDAAGDWLVLDLLCVFPKLVLTQARTEMGGMMC